MLGSRWLRESLLSAGIKGDSEIREREGGQRKEKERVMTGGRGEKRP